MEPTMRNAQVRSVQVVLARFIRELCARHVGRAGILMTLLAATLSADPLCKALAAESAGANALANDGDLVDVIVDEVPGNAVGPLAEPTPVARTFAIASSDTGGLLALDAVSQAALGRALDEGFAASGIPGVAVGLWIPRQRKLGCNARGG
jgi:hypothetical protein